MKCVHVQQRTAAAALVRLPTGISFSASNSSDNSISSNHNITTATTTTTTTTITTITNDSNSSSNNKHLFGLQQVSSQQVLTSI